MASWRVCGRCRQMRGIYIANNMGSKEAEENCDSVERITLQNQ